MSSEPPVDITPPTEVSAPPLPDSADGLDDKTDVTLLSTSQTSQETQTEKETQPTTDTQTKKGTVLPPNPSPILTTFSDISDKIKKQSQTRKLPVSSTPSEKLQCYKCGKNGHLGSECTKAAAMPTSSSGTTLIRMTGGSVMKEVYGDLMSAPDSLCHCVSECMAMGAGIAVLFKQGFGRVDELKAQNVKVGGVAVLDVTAKGAANPRMAYYLVTKPRYFHKPTYGSLSLSLAAMFSDMMARGINRIAMPELGCGLDKLEWPKVRDLVCNQIDGKGIEVTVYHYKPALKLHARNGNFAAKK